MGAGRRVKLQVGASFISTTFAMPVAVTGISQFGGTMAEARVTILDVAKSVSDVGERLRAQIASHGWSTEANVHTQLNWMAPSTTAAEAKAELDYAAARVRAANDENLSDEQRRWLFRLKLRADELQFSNISSDFAASFGAAYELANAVFRHFPWPGADPEVDWEDIREQKHLLPKDLLRRLRFVATQLEGLEPRSAEIDKKISEIETAHAAAEQLPVDMAELASRREELRKQSDEVVRLAASTEAAHQLAVRHRDNVSQAAEATEKRLQAIEEQAQSALDRAERALSGATGVGLARAFEKRREGLALATILWTVCLAIALAAAWWIGKERVAALKEVLVDGKSPSIIWANVFLTVLGLGGPIWFAWLSTKQIGTTFRLSEDYGFKASVSQAYEGYRSEAVQMDEALKVRLFATALDRIEEAPIRLVDPTYHSSPVQEFVAMPAIKKQLDALPDVSGEVISFIKEKLSAATGVVGSAAGAAAAAASAAKKMTGKEAEQSTGGGRAED